MSIKRRQNNGGAKITGIGYCLPEIVLSNHDFEKFLDTSDEWIVTITGIRGRRMARVDEASSDKAIEAS